MLGEDLSARQARGSPTRTHPEQSSAPGGDTAGPGVEGRAPQDAGVEPLEGCRELSVGLGEPPAPKLASGASLYPVGSLRPCFSSLLSSLLYAFPQCTKSCLFFPLKHSRSQQLPQKSKCVHPLQLQGQAIFSDQNLRN